MQNGVRLNGISHHPRARHLLGLCDLKHRFVDRARKAHGQPWGLLPSIRVLRCMRHGCIMLHHFDALKHFQSPWGIPCSKTQSRATRSAPVCRSKMLSARPYVFPIGCPYALLQGIKALFSNLVPSVQLLKALFQVIACGKELHGVLNVSGVLHHLGGFVQSQGEVLMRAPAVEPDCLQILKFNL